MKTYVLCPANYHFCEEQHQCFEGIWEVVHEKEKLEWTLHGALRSTTAHLNGPREFSTDVYSRYPSKKVYFSPPQNDIAMFHLTVINSFTIWRTGVLRSFLYFLVTVLYDNFLFSVLMLYGEMPCHLPTHVIGFIHHFFIDAQPDFKAKANKVIFPSVYFLNPLNDTLLDDIQ